MVNRTQLDALYSKWNTAQFLKSDPLHIPHEYTDPLDQEAVAIVAALLAYGRVGQIHQSVRGVLSAWAAIGSSPKEALSGLSRNLERQARLRDLLKNWKHRFQVGNDLVALSVAISESWLNYGSVGAHFARGGSQGIHALVSDWRNLLEGRGYEMTYGLQYLLTSPEKGSVCKRWNMLLRWMVRKDAVDLGLWQIHGLKPRDLKMPLDTHTARICAYLGLRDRKSLDWQAVEEVTSRLSLINPEDPVRYDFAMARLGILDLCTLKDRPSICAECDLAQGCRYRMTKK